MYKILVNVCDGSLVIRNKNEETPILERVLEKEIKGGFQTKEQAQRYIDTVIFP